MPPRRSQLNLSHDSGGSYYRSQTKMLYRRLLDTIHTSIVMLCHYVVWWKWKLCCCCVRACCRRRPPAEDTLFQIVRKCLRFERIDEKITYLVLNSSLIRLWAGICPPLLSLRWRDRDRHKKDSCSIQSAHCRVPVSEVRSGTSVYLRHRGTKTTFLNSYLLGVLTISISYLPYVAAAAVVHLSRYLSHGRLYHNNISYQYQNRPS